ncbi:MAG: YfcE family phosphodiesterase [Candidatus Lokiarchaeota archaeon]|nr:YfcE family phosphodiesterase [Candidatus Lokiarchaeota archaeon]
MRILVIGDSHIPRRASEVPPIIMDKLNQLSNQLFDYIFFTGDVINAPDFMIFLKSLSKNRILRVIGNMDYYGGSQDAPVYQNLAISLESNNKLIIGLTHGHQISPRGDHSQLEELALQRNYNILISGHTHKEEIVLTKNNILLINPGSVTGAWSFIASRNPSFIVIQIDKKASIINITLHQYNFRSSSFKDLNLSYYFDNKKIFVN